MIMEIDNRRLQELISNHGLSLNSQIEIVSMANELIRLRNAVSLQEAALRCCYNAAAGNLNLKSSERK